MNWIQIIAGPAIGGVIGYFTNYIAVKMLFRPYSEKKLFGRTLPFTPGIIPKRRGDLARAVGKAISDSLLRREDLSAMLAADEVTDAIAGGIESAVSGLIHDRTLREAAGAVVGEERVDALIEKAESGITRRIAGKLEEMDLGTMIGSIAARTVSERVHGSMLAMFVTPDLIASFTDPMAQRINEYILGDGMDQIGSFLSAEIERLSALDARETLHYDAESVRGKIGTIYRRFIEEHASDLTKHFDIAGTVEEKINAMDVRELEKLILSVMKNELNAIVNLGAVLGFLIGFLNTLVQYLLK